MSTYKRDDKAFKAQICALADAGLNFPSARVGGPALKQLRHEPQPMPEALLACHGFTFGKAYKLGNVPAYVRVIEPTKKPAVELPLPRRIRAAEAMGGLLAWVVIIALAGIVGAGVFEAIASLVAGVV